MKGVNPKDEYFASTRYSFMRSWVEKNITRTTNYLTTLQELYGLYSAAADLQVQPKVTLANFRRELDRRGCGSKLHRTLDDGNRTFVQARIRVGSESSRLELSGSE